MTTTSTGPRRLPASARAAPEARRRVGRVGIAGGLGTCGRPSNVGTASGGHLSVSRRGPSIPSCRSPAAPPTACSNLRERAHWRPSEAEVTMPGCVGEAPRGPPPAAPRGRPAADAPRRTPSWSPGNRPSSPRGPGPGGHRSRHHEVEDRSSRVSSASPAGSDPSTGSDREPASRSLRSTVRHSGANRVALGVDPVRPAEDALHRKNHRDQHAQRRAHQFKPARRHPDAGPGRSVGRALSTRLRTAIPDRSAGPINACCNCPAANAAASIAPVTMGTVSDSTATAASTSRFDSVRRRPIRLARIASMRALTSAPPTPARPSAAFPRNAGRR